MAFLALLLLIAGSIPVCHAELLTVEGEDRAQYLIIDHELLHSRIPDYTNLGFAQTVSPEKEFDKLSISVTVNPYLRSVPFAYPAAVVAAAKGREGPDTTDDPVSTLLLQELEPLLRKETLSSIEAITRALLWTVSRMKPDLDSPTAPDLATAVQRGRGNCVDLCRLAQRVFEAMGISHRIVHGIIFTAPPGQTGNQATKQPAFHRWLEVKVSPTDWMFCDPTASIGFVTADYLVLYISDSELAPPPSLDESVFLRYRESIVFPSRARGLHITDCRSDSHHRMFTRRFSAVQHTCAVFGNVRFRGPVVEQVQIGFTNDTDHSVLFPLQADGAYSAYCLDPGFYYVFLLAGTESIGLGHTLMSAGEVTRRDYVISMR